MHEMSIALSIVDLVSDQFKLAEAESVKEVELDIGTISGVELEALKFALEIATKSTLMEDAAIKINTIQAESLCLECNHVFESELYFSQCPKCKELNTKILKGKELQVKSILVE